MFIDVIVLVLVVLALYKGFRNGLVVGIFSFLSFLIGLAAAMKLSAAAADYIGNNVHVSQRWLPFIAFAAVFIIVILLVRLGAKAIERVLQVAMLGWLNRLGGIILYALVYFFIFSILLFYAVQLQLIKQETLAASATYPYLEPFAPKMISALGYVVPFFKGMFAELEQFFGSLAEKASTS